MNLKPSLAAAVCSFLLFSGLRAAEPGKITRIEIDCSTARFPVNRELYGAFYEEINHAGDGGLYAELLRNRTFEDTVLPDQCSYRNGILTSPTGWTRSFPEPETVEGWSLSEDAKDAATLQLDSSGPLNPAQKRSLKIGKRGADDRPMGVVNRGFGGIPIEAGKTYRLAFWTRAEGRDQRPIAVSLQSAKGEDATTVRLTEPAALWSRREVEMTSSITDPHATLRIETRGSGPWWIDEVSLFPVETFNRRRNGLRLDLVERIAALKPSFLRFPGGCIVEGFSRQTIWHWKNSIGDIADRSGHWLMWGYRTTMGLGFHEFLQLCDDLKMAPLFVFNCGMTCQGRSGELLPTSEVDSLLQEALDALEYANGSEQSRWGALRARNGHPAPFNLKYVEIGNENHGPGYEERYARFYQAIHERYPAIRIIANNPVASAPVDILDEHYYPDPDFFIAHADHYDSYARSGPKVYVGEFAATQRVGTGNLRGAVSEAAFLTGIERNQDLVCMASYAPLLAKFDDRAWTPDAIYFDNHRSFGAPIYHVLKLFAENRGDEVLNLQIETDRKPYSNPGIARMEIAGPAEVRDFLVNIGGDEFSASRQQPDVLDSTLTFEAKISGEGGVASLRFRDNGKEADQRDYCILTLAGSDRKDLRVRHIVGWVEEPLGGVVLDQPLDMSRWHRVKVEAKGTEIRVWLDGREVLCARNRWMPAIVAVATRENAAQTLIVKIVNTTNLPQEIALTLKSASSGATQALASTITSGSLDDENSFAEPERVSARTESWPLRDDGLTHMLKPNSINVVRVPLARDAQWRQSSAK